jgi:putative sterol carrier protein
MEWCRKTKKMKPFLVDNKELGRDFRNLFLDRLTQLVEQGKIKLEEAGYIADLIGELRLQDWVAFIEGSTQTGMSTKPDAKVLNQVPDRWPDFQRQDRW